MELISRDDAIKMIRGWFDIINLNPDILVDSINSLPTIEELVTVEYKQNEGLYLNTDEDTLLETEYIVLSTDGMYKEYVHEDGREQGQKRGKWIDHPTVENIGLVDLQGNEMEIAMKMCSECGYEGWETDYCPNCGAKMENNKESL